MKHILLGLAMTAALLGCAKSQQDSGRLINGKEISPAEPMQNVGSLPMNLILSPDGQYAISTDMGYRQSLWSIRLADGKGVSHVDFLNIDPTTRRSRNSARTSESAIPMGGGVQRANGLYYGLAIATDGTLYAAQGNLDRIAILKLSSDGQLSRQGSIPTRKHDFPAGLALDERGILYVSNNAAGFQNPYELTASVALYDTHTNKEVGRYSFSASYGGTSNFPYGIVATRGGEKVYVASERDDRVYVLNAKDPSKPTLSTTIAVGARPASVLLSRDQRRLFVANTLSDTISIIDTAEDKVEGTVFLRPAIVRDLPGVSPTGMALSDDQKTLYVALGDMNAIAVVQVATHEKLSGFGWLSGYIPAGGWYPSALAVAPDGKSILVANAKGVKARNPNNRSDPYDSNRKNASTLAILEGSIVQTSLPKDDDQLAKSSQEVMKENRLDRALPGGQVNPLENINIHAGRIEHVIYIVKENRTYDQVLGDMPQGNGDKSLVLFGKDITPNQHALADRFVLLDNLYACGEVSGDGWCWSTQGMATAYVVRNIPYNYSHRGRAYDFEGTNNTYPNGGAPEKDMDGHKLATRPYFEKGSAPVPDVANTGRNIWDSAIEACATIRNYGFWVYLDDNIAGVPGGPNNYPMAARLQPGGRDLRGVTDLDYRGFDMNYPDSDAPSFFFSATGDKNYLWSKATYGQSKSPSRFSEWNREFQMMLQKDPSGKSVPNLMLIRLPTDHTTAASSGKHVPGGYVADNDYALGQIVEAVSHSPIWPHCAIVVIEDDAQSGADHIDGHRTTAYVISPWIKAHSVDHHFYNTDSLLKTIELLLGAKPLSQYDAIADPVMDWDTSPTNIHPYTAIMPSKELMNQLNPKAATLSKTDPRYEMAEDSDKMDFSHADAAPTQRLNEIVWKSVRGVDSIVPSARGTGKDDDD